MTADYISYLSQVMTLYSYTENLHNSFSFRSVLKKDAARSYKR